ncbi:molybdenum ABC transporter permease [Bacillus sp. WP8]|uniref:molybdate ABC transporter permease subunit n=1 Tax=Bacillus TaxID=1386 RepID=UPI00057D7712|nr:MULTISPECIES: molybdate ABC transporter permease subunit [Bacillus]AIZ61512.1 molybdenum ABC transporter permease [Bacillus sp. WP8]MBR0600895.1 molybdate ABC transporter permease subunit [Bacillus safensis]
MPMMTEEFLSPIWLSVQVAVVSGLLATVFGTLIGYWMARTTFKGKMIVETLLMLPLVLPPTVVGFLLLFIFGRHSMIGGAIEWIFHQPVIFTWWAAVIASTVVAFPLMYQSAKAGFSTIESDIEGAAKVDGAHSFQVFAYITVPLALPSLLSGSILSFARALGEFGATLMFAGNIPGKTQTLPTAIYVAIDSGRMELAWAWTICIMILSFIMLLAVRRSST